MDHRISMESPICLIESPKGRLEVRPEALRVLAGVTQPVVVVAIAGLYRTGKSYLLNRLAGRSKGFSLGSTIQSLTKGIWMWCLPHPRRAGHILVLLDTEGLGDMEKDNMQKDTWIFMLAALLSSTLVYNSMGTIDGSALGRLQYTLELTKRIKVKAEEASSGRDGVGDAAKFVQFFPDFVWTVRDFVLQLEAGGRPITEDEYLERALRLDSDNGEKATEVKKCIRDFFPSRKCFTFDRPAGRRNLPRLEELGEDELEPDFLDAASRFCDHVWDKARPMTILGGHKVTGAALGSLAQSYVASINSGAVPCVESAVEALARKENTVAVADALARYTELMEQRARLPTETLQELLGLHAQCEREALAVFTRRAFKDDKDAFQTQLREELEARREEFCRRNEETSVGRCKAVLAEVSCELEGKISGGSYSVPGGYQLFRADQAALEEKYWQVSGKGIKAAEVLKEFLSAKEALAVSILQTDKALAENEKQLAAEQVRAMAAEKQQQSLEQQKAEMQQKVEATQRSFAEHVRCAEERYEKEKAELIEQHQRAMDHKLQEQARLMEEGRKEEAEQQKREIEALKEELKKASRKECASVAGKVADIVSSLARALVNAIPAIPPKFLLSLGIILAMSALIKVLPSNWGQQGGKPQ